MHRNTTVPLQRCSVSIGAIYGDIEHGYARLKDLIDIVGRADSTHIASA